MAKPFIVVFAGMPGTSKTVIAYHLSTEFSLPILSSDNIRFEVREDLMVDNINIPEALMEFERRYKTRRRNLLAAGRSFILDASVDRHWAEHKNEIVEAGFSWYMIDMELSRPFQEKMFSKTGRPRAIKEVDHYLVQHQAFLAKYKDDINLEITDKTFPDRLNLAAKAFASFIDALK